MKNLLIILLMATLFVFPANNANAAESDILREIKTLREDTNREFKTVREEMKTLRDDTGKRFDQLLWFIGLWIPLSMAVVGYILQRLNKHDDGFFNLLRTINAEDIFMAIKKTDPATKKRLKEVLK
jgi:hypothetical protein